jgi:predicted RNase H-like HicB family nuclease
MKGDGTMKLQISIQIWRKGSWFLAKCPELDFISQGRTKEEAQKNLMEVIEIQFEEMTRMGTLDEYLEECGYSMHDGFPLPQPEMVGFEKLEMQVH